LKEDRGEKTENDCSLRVDTLLSQKIICCMQSEECVYQSSEWCNLCSVRSQWFYENLYCTVCNFLYFVFLCLM